jgi:hypothetical protein
MNVSRDVVVDLLPLYLAGEASAGTRDLIETYMKEHPDFAAEMHARVERGADIFGTATAPAPPDQEKATLERVRRFNRNRTYWLGFAIAYTLVPLSFVFVGSQVRWVMLRDNPKQAILFWICALGCWTAYYMMGRRLRQTHDG